MAHLWMKNESDEWALLLLEADAYGLAGRRPVRLTARSGRADASCGVAIRRSGGRAGEAWMLLSRPDAQVAINGRPARLGVAILADRDEIRTPMLGRMFFSTEVSAHVEPFPASGARVFCARCKQDIKADAPAVRCPGCLLWHHESEDLPCWTYDRTCAVCPQETALDAGFRWTPEEL